MLSGKKIVLGVSGGIAAYKACELVSRLKKLNADVHVIMTASAAKFVTPLTFQSLSLNQVAVDMFDTPNYWEKKASDDGRKSRGRAGVVRIRTRRRAESA